MKQNRPIPYFNRLKKTQKLSTTIRGTTGDVLTLSSKKYEGESHHTNIMTLNSPL
eukprot:gnl/Chilomastix_caulleri/2800.p1 GENE.gnl/Chilomastix_caulleri/2800~~gnl/Chilomastix_caulleri/2800.p1  ORF type:complete len:55 (+),score=2.54 gnl/Chilomastix_caulleri/2800:295-459(+)